MAMLDSKQRESAVMAFEHSARTTWSYVPGVRKGIPLKVLGDRQKMSALRLLQASVSESGYKKVDAIRREIEDVLRELEGNSGRDPELYYVSIFGEPGHGGVWAWRFEGHHVSLNFTFVDGRMVATSPQFLGSNPAEVRSGPRKGTRVLAKEEDLARRLLTALDDQQRNVAIIASTAPADIVTSNQRQTSILEATGLEVSRMTDRQRAMLQELVQVYSSVQLPEQAKARLSKIDKAGWGRVRFAWMGSIEPGAGHYYRIQGPTFLIEYDNTQNNANHVHTVWRDFSGDFGRDALKEHYRTAKHHRTH